VQARSSPRATCERPKEDGANLEGCEHRRLLRHFRPSPASVTATAESDGAANAPCDPLKRHRRHPLHRLKPSTAHHRPFARQLLHPTCARRRSPPLFVHLRLPGVIRSTPILRSTSYHLFDAEVSKSRHAKGTATTTANAINKPHNPCPTDAYHWMSIPYSTRDLHPLRMTSASLHVARVRIQDRTQWQPPDCPRLRRGSRDPKGSRANRNRDDGTVGALLHRRRHDDAFRFAAEGGALARLESPACSAVAGPRSQATRIWRRVVGAARTYRRLRSRRRVSSNRGDQRCAT